MTYAKGIAKHLVLLSVLKSSATIPEKQNSLKNESKATPIDLTSGFPTTTDCMRYRNELARKSVFIAMRT
eukprot:IDg14617t1